MQPNRTACLAALACIASPALAGGEAYRVPEYPAPPVVVYAPPPPPAYAIGGILAFPFQFLDGLFGAPQPLVPDGYGGLVPFTNSRVAASDLRITLSSTACDIRSGLRLPGR